MFDELNRVFSDTLCEGYGSRGLEERSEGAESSDLGEFLGEWLRCRGLRCWLLGLVQNCDATRFWLKLFSLL